MGEIGSITNQEKMKKLTTERIRKQRETLCKLLVDERRLNFANDSDNSRNSQNDATAKSISVQFDREQFIYRYCFRKHLKFIIKILNFVRYFRFYLFINSKSGAQSGGRVEHPLCFRIGCHSVMH